MRRKHAPQPADPPANLNHRHDQLLAVPSRLEQVVVQVVDPPDHIVDGQAIALDLPAEEHREEGRRVERPGLARPLERLAEVLHELDVGLVRRCDPSVGDDADHVTRREVVVRIQADHLDSHEVLEIDYPRVRSRLQQRRQRAGVVVQDLEYVGQVSNSLVGDGRIEPDERVVALFES